MKIIKAIENRLNGLLVRDMPALPVYSKKFIVKYLSWINLALGLITLLAAESLKSWADSSTNATNCANSLGAIYGGPVSDLAHLSLTIWVGLGALVAVALLFFAAWRDTRFQKFSGWYLMFYALLMTVFYSVVILFTTYGISYTVFSFLGGIFGLYVLFQIRSGYIKD